MRFKASHSATLLFSASSFLQFALQELDALLRFVVPFVHSGSRCRRRSGVPYSAFFALLPNLLTVAGQLKTRLLLTLVPSPLPWTVGSSDISTGSWMFIHSAKCMLGLAALACVGKMSSGRHSDLRGT
jgi:hypothetical protein